MNTSSGRSAARAMTAAARAALPQLAMASRGGGPLAPCDASPRRHAQVQQQSEEVPALVRARHVAGLVLQPEAAWTESQTLSEALVREERRDGESPSVDCRHRHVEVADDGAELTVVHTRLASEVVRRQPMAIPKERLRGRVIDQPPVQRRNDRTDDMIDVVARDAPPGTSTAAGRLAAHSMLTPAAGAHEVGACHAHRAPTAAPLRALNSTIISSHAGSRSPQATPERLAGVAPRSPPTPPPAAPPTCSSPRLKMRCRSRSRSSSTWSVAAPAMCCP